MICTALAAYRDEFVVAVIRLFAVARQNGLMHALKARDG
jgi:hypothetical protein